MPDLAAVAPLAGAADAVEVVEGVARPGAGMVATSALDCASVRSGEWPRCWRLDRCTW